MEMKNSKRNEKLQNVGESVVGGCIPEFKERSTEDIHDRDIFEGACVSRLSWSWWCVGVCFVRVARHPARMRPRGRQYELYTLPFLCPLSHTRTHIRMRGRGCAAPIYTRVLWNETAFRFCNVGGSAF